MWPTLGLYSVAAAPVGGMLYEWLTLVMVAGMPRVGICVCECVSVCCTLCMERHSGHMGMCCCRKASILHVQPDSLLALCRNRREAGTLIQLLHLLWQTVNNSYICYYYCVASLFSTHPDKCHRPNVHRWSLYCLLSV